MGIISKLRATFAAANLPYVLVIERSASVLALGEALLIIDPTASENRRRVAAGMLTTDPITTEEQCWRID